MPSWERSRLKTLWEKKEMLVTSIFTFSHNVFFPIKEKLHLLSNIKIVVCKYFQCELLDTLHTMTYIMAITYCDIHHGYHITTTECHSVFPGIALSNGASLEDMTDITTVMTTDSEPETTASVTDSPLTTDSFITETSTAPPGTSKSSAPSTAKSKTSMSASSSLSSSSPTSTVPLMTSDHTSSMEPSGSSNAPANSSTVSTASSTSSQPTSSSSATTPSTQTSPKASPKTTPKPEGRRFDAGSFVGGIVLGMVLLLIGFLIYRCIKVRRGKEQFGYGRVQ